MWTGNATSFWRMAPLDDLDHAANFPRYGSKMGIDATRKTREEGMMREWPEELFMSDDVKALFDRRWKEYGFLERTGKEE